MPIPEHQQLHNYYSIKVGHSFAIKASQIKMIGVMGPGQFYLCFFISGTKIGTELEAGLHFLF
jgi:hypothetical protein